MKIIAFETEDWEVAAFGVLEAAHDFHCVAHALAPPNAADYADAESVTVFIGSDLSAATLRQLPRLKLVATRSTGFDHIDLDYCRGAGVAVCNVPDYGDPTVAEHTFALLLAVSRRVVEAAERTRRGDFSPAGLRGLDLAGRTLGVIGAGRIGQRVIAIARGFGMQVLALDAYPDAAVAQRLGFRYVELPELLAGSDVITLHLPGGPQTHDLISDREFGLMKPGAVLINTARGGVVDAAALVRALSGGRLAGAGLDVLAEEGLVREEAELFRSELTLQADQLRRMLANNALVRFPNVVVTPHIAYDTREAVQRIIETTVDNIVAFADGRRRNRID
jgi:D-lactate dehydrogenase